MAERLYDYSKLTPEQRQHLEEIESEIEKAQKQLLEQTPEHIIELGDILRRSIETDELDEFRSYLQKHEIDIAGGKHKLEAFRDLLVIQRIDLKDLEPAARARLRSRTLNSEDPSMMTKDYQDAASTGVMPVCKDCRWFVTPPKDGGEGSDKSCVQLGTKGADMACYGFTSSTN
jgi:hypothetical protein